MNCLACGEHLDEDDFAFPWDEGITCPYCKAEMETDWEHVTWDHLVWWPTKLKNAGRSNS